MTPMLAVGLAVIIPACVWYLVRQHLEWSEREQAEKRIRDLKPMSDDWREPR